MCLGLFHKWLRILMTKISKYNKKKEGNVDSLDINENIGLPLPCWDIPEAWGLCTLDPIHGIHPTQRLPRAQYQSHLHSLA